MRLRVLCSALLLLFSTLAPRSAQAQAVSLNWDSCTGTLSKTIDPETPVDLVVSVLGHSAPHKGYSVEVTVGHYGASTLADAWRFDAPGCQGSSQIMIDHLSPAHLTKTCPSFQGALFSNQVKGYNYDAMTGKARAVVVNSYPAGNTTQVNPAVRYFLARFRFDHANSVNGAGTPGTSCGSFEWPVCFLLWPASYVTTSGVEAPWALAQEYASANDPTFGHACFAVPAAPSTWGTIKSQYRR